MDRESLASIIKDIRNYIKLEKESGPAEFMLKKIATHKSQNSPGGEYFIKDKKKALEELRQEVSACRECALCSLRRNTVFGEGNPDASLMFIGEAPGLQEDIQARPFVGTAGALLTKIIEAIGFKREDIYITNCLKCRPPQNRDPLPTEIVACRDFFMRQIEIIKPKIICCLGKFAAQTLLMSEEAITRLRGKFYDFEGIKVMVTFHPAYLLRNPQDKRLVWEDMKRVRDYLKKSKSDE